MKYQIWITTMANTKECVYQSDNLDRAKGVLEFLKQDEIETWHGFYYKLITK